MTYVNTGIRIPIGADHRLIFEVLDASDHPVNVSSWPLSWMLKRRLSDTDAQALLVKTTTSGATVVGNFNADRGSNTQRVYVDILDTDTDGRKPGIAHGELKRTDAGFEAILSRDEIELWRTVHQS